MNDKEFFTDKPCAKKSIASFNALLFMQDIITMYPLSPAIAYMPIG